MTPEELLRSEAGKWLRQAARDLNAARLLVEAEPTRSLFHSQQAAEKAAKAFPAYPRSRLADRPERWLRTR